MLLDRDRQGSARIRGLLWRAALIETIGAGDLLGWSWMFPPYVWHFTARAIEPTTAIFFYGSILREYCEKRSLVRLRAFEADKCGDGEALAGCP